MRYRLVTYFDERLPKPEQLEAPPAETIESPTALLAAISRQIRDPRFGSLRVIRLDEQDGETPAAA